MSQAALPGIGGSGGPLRIGNQPGSVCVGPQSDGVLAENCHPLRSLLVKPDTPKASSTLRNPISNGFGFLTRIGIGSGAMKAIVQLPAEDLDKLMDWLEDYRAQMWDEQIEKDLEAGRLDTLLAEVHEEYEARMGTWRAPRQT
jgi:hypothetical protein